MKDGILITLFTIELIITLNEIFNICIHTDDKKYRDKMNFLLSPLCDLIRNLFIGKNFLGIILGIIILIILIPTIIMVLLLEIVFWIFALGIMIYDFGNRKSK